MVQIYSDSKVDKDTITKSSVVSLCREHFLVEEQDVGVGIDMSFQGFSDRSM